MINQKTVIKRSPVLITRKIENSFLVLDPQEEKIHELNKSAELIFRYLWKPRRIAEIAKLITDRYAISNPKALNDIIKFINNALKNRLLLAR